MEYDDFWKIFGKNAYNKLIAALYWMRDFAYIILGIMFCFFGILSFFVTKPFVSPGGQIVVSEFDFIILGYVMITIGALFLFAVKNNFVVYKLVKRIEELEKEK